MTTLAALYSYLDGLKRKGRAFTRDPLGEIDQGVRNLGEDQAKMLAAQDVVMSKSVLVTPEQRQQALTQLADYGGSVGLAGTFAGIGAKTADRFIHDIAVKQLKSGADPAKVWRDLGWGRGPDGKMRFEIDDRRMQLANTKLRDFSGSIKEAVDHKPLFDAYPSTADLSFNLKSGGRGGSHIPYGRFDGSIAVRGAENNARAKSTTLHELQHAVQTAEKFAPGGDPSHFAASVRGSQMSKEAAQAQQYDLYRRLGGEAEARLTQSRMNMSPLQRAEQYPWERRYFNQATGVPLNQLINDMDLESPLMRAIKSR